MKSRRDVVLLEESELIVDDNFALFEKPRHRAGLEVSNVGARTNTFEIPENEVFDFLQKHFMTYSLNVAVPKEKNIYKFFY
jgi:hypothetical protein